MREHKDAVKGLWKRFLSDDYVVIEVDFPRIYNPMFVDLNDFQFIMPPFMLVPPYTEEDFLHIVQALEQGKFYPSVFPSYIIQGLIPFLRDENVTNIYPMFEIE